MSETNNTDNEFNFQPQTPEEVKERQHKILTISLTLGGMLLAIIILITVLISYSVGYDHGSSVNDTDETINTASADSSGDSDKLSGDAAEYQSQNKVGEGQIPDHFKGNQDGKIKVITFADHTCTYCIQLANGMSDIYDKYGDDVQFIYRNYGIGNTYSDVTAKIAEAAYVAGSEDGYWKMHDRLYGDTTWIQGEYMDTNALNDKIKSSASEAGLDGQAVLDAYNNSANNGIDAKIERDRSLAKSGNVSGTPTVFINGESVRGQASSIASKLDELLEK